MCVCECADTHIWKHVMDERERIVYISLIHIDHAL